MYFSYNLHRTITCTLRKKNKTSKEREFIYPLLFDVIVVLFVMETPVQNKEDISLSTCMLDSLYEHPFYSLLEY